jgi:hypothetical protein
MPRLRAAALAAALAAAVLAGACKPSSLTPFGIGRRGPAPGSVNGLWQGVTTRGGDVEFSVAAEKVQGLTLTHPGPGCTKRFTSGGVVAVIADDDTFKLELFFDTGGRLVIDGAFSSIDAASGSYFFEGLAAAPPCPTAGSGGFVAGNVR